MENAEMAAKGIDRKAVDEKKPNSSGTEDAEDQRRRITKRRLMPNEDNSQTNERRACKGEHFLNEVFER